MIYNKQMLEMVEDNQTEKDTVTSLLRKYQTLDKRIAELATNRDAVRSKIEAEYTKHKAVVAQIDQVIRMVGTELIQLETEQPAKETTPTKPQVKQKPRAVRHRGEVKAKIIDALKSNPDATNVAIAKQVYGEGNAKGKDVYVSIIRSQMRKEAQPLSQENSQSA